MFLGIHAHLVRVPHVSLVGFESHHLGIRVSLGWGDVSGSEVISVCLVAAYCLWDEANYQKCYFRADMRRGSSKPMGSHFGIGAPPILVYIRGDWDVHTGGTGF